MEPISDALIKQFLENAPLYKWEDFGKPRINRDNLLIIDEIDAHCPTCEMLRPFKGPMRGSGYGSAPKPLQTGSSMLAFNCVSCRKEKIIFMIDHIVEEHSIRLQKSGESPRKPLSRDRAINSFLRSDNENYEKAVVCLANGYGIGAYAYLRRIVETNISVLLDMLQEDATASGGDPGIESALAELRKDSPMKEKIRVANLALPPYLKPDGLNPLGRLYQELSEGIHGRSDAECLDRARNVSICLSYLINELTNRRTNRERFKSMVGRV